VRPSQHVDAVDLMQRQAVSGFREVSAGDGLGPGNAEALRG
jgi:hypothetical protein